MERTVQIVFSPTGGTQKAADLLAQEWNNEVVKVDLSSATEDFSAAEVREGDVAVIAVPSFGGRVPALAAQRLSKIKGNGARCVVMCVYGNRAYEDTLIELGDIAANCGFKVIAAVAAVAEHSICHQYAAGRPDGDDAEKLRGFAGQIKAKIDGGEENSPQIPGNRPYKKAGGAPLVPKADGKCNNCGICAAQCPAQAIDVSNPKATDAKKCISCMRCVAVCPQHARGVNKLMVSAAAMMLKKVCSVRKECELYL